MSLLSKLNNFKLLDEAENILKSLLSNGVRIYVENPDGVMYELKEGFKIHSDDMIIKFKED